MNIVFGGTFNPPTLAHEKMIDYLLDYFKPENLLLVPSGEYNYKASEKYAYYRLEMLKLIAEDKKNIKIIDYEVGKKFNGTYQTLKVLSNDYANLHFVMGSDNLPDFSKWIEFEKLIEEYKFIVFMRKDYDAKEIINKLYPKYIKNFIVIPFDEEMSSSAIRNNLKENESALNPKIYDYIKKHKIY